MNKLTSNINPLTGKPFQLGDAGIVKRLSKGLPTGKIETTEKHKIGKYDSNEAWIWQRDKFNVSIFKWKEGATKTIKDSPFMWVTGCKYSELEKVKWIILKLLDKMNTVDKHDSFWYFLDKKQKFKLWEIEEILKSQKP